MTGRGHIELVGPTWWLRVRERVVDPATGEIRQVSRRTRIGSKFEYRSRVTARAAADEWLARLNPDVLAAGPELLAVAYFEEFIRTRLPLMRTSSQRRYRYIIRRRLTPEFRGKRLHEINGAAIRTMIARLAPELSRATVGSIRAVLLQILRQAIGDGYGACRINSRDVPLPKVSSAERLLRAIADPELERILVACDWPWKALWAVMGFAGLRVGEALGLTWEHVDLERRVLRIRQNCVAGQLLALKTRSSRADLPMLERLVAILTEYANHWRPNTAGLLFATAKGTPLASDDVRRRQLHPLLRRLSLPAAGCHAFRHGLPQRLDAIGMSPAAIQRLLRHQSLAMTEKYLHLGTDEFAAAIAEANARLSNKTMQAASSRVNSITDTAGIQP